MDRAIYVVTLTLALAALGVPASAGDPPEPSEFTKGHLCKALVATVMGRDPLVVRIDSRESGVISLSYVRRDDGTLWAYKCRVEGNRIRWASATGRWRTDSVTTYRIDGESVRVTDQYADGSATRRSFTLSELGPG